TLDLVPSGGSRDNLDKLANGSVELALVQSGLELSVPQQQRERLYSLGTLYQEPLWLFMRGEQQFNRLSDLLPLRVAVGSSSSGAGAVVHALLQANQIDTLNPPPGWQALSGSRAAEALIAGELDAAFFIGPAENALIQRLAAVPELRLTSLRRTDAYQAR